MHKNRTPITMGPAAVAATTPRFWNVVQGDGDNAELTVYGEIVTKRPKDWWTGEPDDGLFTTPKEFLEDLNLIKGAKNVTVRINSVGGDLYTAIGISNRLKELTGNTVAIIDGVAASAATVIAMGCDTIQAYPGSLFMVHEAAVTLVGVYNHDALAKVNKGLEAANSAAAETYESKTHLGIDKIRNAMAKETWLTGREAAEKGWIDEVLEGEDPEMSLSADKEMITVNGLRMSASAFSNLPGSIPVAAQAAAQLNTATPTDDKPAKASAAANTTKTKKNKEDKHMTLEELKQAEPELVAQITADAAAEAKNQAITDERARLQAIQEIAATVGDQEMVNEAMYGENACTASELALRAMQKQAKLGTQHIQNQAQDFQQSGAAGVAADPNGGNPEPDLGDSKELSEEDAVKMIAGTFNNDKEGK